MAILQIRDLPEGLYQLLRRRSEAQRRSLTQEAVIALEQGLSGTETEGRVRRRQVLAEAVSNPIGLPSQTPSPAALIREDRNR